MDSGRTSEPRKVVDAHVTSEQDIVCQGDAFAHQAIMRNVAAGHDEAVLANSCLGVSFSRCVDLYVLTKARSGTYDDRAFLPGRRGHLRRRSDYRMRANADLAL